MRYYKNIENGYLLAVGTGFGGEEIAAEEYNHIINLIQSSPEAEEGYEYLLREDLTWELVEAPVSDPADDEISAEEALYIILGGEG